ncbi:hypothetical protein AGMMS49983_00180 [Clostridia bacterium]|nr:hypothetical protein AGMMS49983_00180 [Clostridia bacterium]
MYTIFETGGKQYKVAAGDVLRIEKVAGAAGDSIQFTNVIAFSAGDGSLKTGTPFLDATVNATILGEGKGKKVIVFKFKAKKDYRKKNGHRQPFTEIEIENFTVDGTTVGEKPEKPVEVKAEKVSAAEPEPVKEEKAKKPSKAEKAETAKVAEEAEEKVSETELAEETPAADEAQAEAEVPAFAVIPDEPAEAAKEEIPASKLTKAEIMEKLDALGAVYTKSAKKDELLAILAEAESK